GELIGILNAAKVPAD
nr:Chain C, Triosephosphate isomerase peptide [synthetic construct]2IAM_P Chain P, 15-mer peptide from Triosephosphate isomerase [Homo sapiens]4E41_C Chain C, Triosephosphate isomerase [Homo sapiens]4E41_H Chain H, Triosephosphate isomerase [Homo sapiens]